MKKKITVNVIIHMVLIILAVICLFPIFLVLINSFKENAEIVRNPLSLPDFFPPRGDNARTGQGATKALQYAPCNVGE